MTQKSWKVTTHGGDGGRAAALASRTWAESSWAAAIRHRDASIAKLRAENGRLQSELAEASSVVAGRQLVAPQRLAGEAFQHWTVLVNPREDKIPGKTGLFDESIVWDRDLWAGRLFTALIRSREPGARLWSLTSAKIIEHLTAAAHRLGLHGLGVCRYSLRHGGASEDLLTGARDIAAIKKRGAWACDNSLRRYSKEARAQTEVAKIPPAIQSYGRFVADNLEAIMTNQMRPPIPPAIGIVGLANDKKRTLHPGRRARQRVG